MSKKICIIGGGNLGMILAAKFSINNDVLLYTKKANKYKNNEIIVFGDDNKEAYRSKNLKISDNLESCIKGAEYIFITYPSLLFETLAKVLIPLLSKNQHLVGVPGSGGFELFFKDALNKGCTITGLQRVHSVARIIEESKIVHEMGVRSSLRVASIPNSYNSIACKDLSSFYNLPVESLDCYLNITLVNSNPILHTSRLYTLFKDYVAGKSYSSLPLFYEEWSIESSELLIKMDNELFTIIAKLNKNNLKVNDILPLLEHYESYDAISLTNKIKSISSFKGLATPAIKLNEFSYIPDFSSRYFTADFPLGLDIILSFANLLNIFCPNLEKVSKWYHSLNEQYNYFSLNKFNINSVKNIIELYK